MEIRSTTRRSVPPRGRIRNGVLHRLLQHVAIPLAALLVIAWGVLGNDDPPPFSDAALVAPTATDRSDLAGTAESAAGIRRATTPPLRAVTWPATPTVAGSPAASPSPAAMPARTSALAASPRPTVTATVASPPTPSTTPGGCGSTPPPGGDQTPVLTTAPVNLRSGPGLSCPVVVVLAPGTTAVTRGAPISADGRLWLPIEAAGRSGWVAADFLRATEP